MKNTNLTRAAASLLACGMVFGLTACSSSASSSEATAESAASSEAASESTVPDDATAESGYFSIIQLFCKKYSPAFTKGKRVCYNTRGRAPNALPWAADLLPGYPYIRKGTEPYGKRKNRAHQCAGS